MDLYQSTLTIHLQGLCASSEVGSPLSALRALLIAFCSHPRPRPPAPVGLPPSSLPAASLPAYPATSVPSFALSFDAFAHEPAPSVLPDRGVTGGNNDCAELPN